MAAYTNAPIIEDLQVEVKQADQINPDDSQVGAAIILFALGFINPAIWIINIYVFRSNKHPKVKKYTRLSAILLGIFVAAWLGVIAIAVIAAFLTVAD